MSKPHPTDLLARARESLQKANDAIANQVLIGDQIQLLAVALADVLRVVENGR